jgi:TonB family protein
VSKEPSKDEGTASSPNEVKKKEEVKKEEVKKEEPLTLTKLPVLKKFVEAKYPENLRKEKIEGIVTLFIDVDENGKVINVGVIKTDNKDFDAPAIDAIKQFEFIPAEYKEKKVPVRITYQYNFVIKDKKEASKEEIEKAEKEKTTIVEKVDYDSIKGTVLGYGNREPLSYVTVRVISPSKEEFEEITDGNGNFLFKNLEDGEYKLVVDPKDHYLGYETTEAIKKGELVNIKISLPQDLLNPYELTVVKKKAKKEVTKQVISIQEVMKIPGTNGDAIKVVQNLPGISRPAGLGGQIIIRGSNNNESKIFIDGYEVPLIYHFGGLASVYNSELLEDVSYFPSAYSVKYGRSLGGVIDVKTRLVKTKEENKNIHGYVDIDLIDSSAMVEVPIDEKSGVAVAVRRSYIDTILPFVLPSNLSDVIISLPVYYDWQIQYNRKISRKDTISFVHWGSKDSFELFLGKPQGDPNISGDFSFGIYSNTTKVDWYHKFNKTLKLKTSLGVQYSKRAIKIGELINFDLSVWEIPLRADLEYVLNKYVTINTGVDIRNQIYSADITAPDLNRTSGGGNSDSFQPIGTYEVVRSKQDGTTLYPAIYSEFLIDIADFRFIPGLRLDYFSNNNYLSFDPRLGILYKLNKDIVLKGSTGVYHLPAGVDQTNESVGNPDLVPAYSIQNSIGLEYRFTDFITSSVEFFYNKQNDLVVPTSEKVVRDGEVVEKNQDNLGEGRAYGMEIFIRHNMNSRFFGWISYTLMRSERKDTPQDDWELFRYDQTHILTILGSYKLPYGFEIGARVRYVTGSPTTPVIGSIYDADSGTYSQITGAPLSIRNEPFFQADLRIDKTWQFKTWTLTSYLDIQNVTYYTNQEGTQYNYDYTESKPVEGIPIFPSFGVKGEF